MVMTSIFWDAERVLLVVYLEKGHGSKPPKEAKMVMTSIFWDAERVLLVDYLEKGHGSKPPKEAKMVATSIFWDAERVLLVDYLDKGHAITGTYYADLLRQLREKIKQIRRGKLRRGVLFHQDNALAHTFTVAMAAIQKCGFQLVEDSLYSPDLVPTDCSRKGKKGAWGSSFCQR